LGLKQPEAFAVRLIEVPTPDGEGGAAETLTDEHVPNAYVVLLL
jgi:hypothetical protein